MTENRVLPILFNTEMVRTILDKVKRETRRTIKGYIPYDAVWGYTIFTPKATISCRGTFENGYGEKFFKLPCEIGDILYVRETWYYEEHMHDLTAGEPDLSSGRYLHRYVYKASSPDYPVNTGVGRQGWKPSIHMPKEAARIFLKVTDVRVKRLQDITAKDIENEGVIYDKGQTALEMVENAINEFEKLWNSTVKEEWQKYENNPWVWVIEFERCEKPRECKR